MAIKPKAKYRFHKAAMLVFNFKQFSVTYTFIKVLQLSTIYYRTLLQHSVECPYFFYHLKSPPVMLLPTVVNLKVGVVLYDITFVQKFMESRPAVLNLKRDTQDHLHHRHAVQGAHTSPPHHFSAVFLNTNRSNGL